jgi:hypothetical protein
MTMMMTTMMKRNRNQNKADKTMHTVVLTGLLYFFEYLMEVYSLSLMFRWLQ